MSLQEENIIPNAINAELMSIELESTVQNADTLTAKIAPTLQPESAINVLKKKLDDLQIRVKLLSQLDHELIKPMESKIMSRIETLTMELVEEFIHSQNPGEVPEKPKPKKISTGHGTISVTGVST
jgi:hypothetical protein